MKAEKCRRSLAEFVRAAWPTVEPGTELVWGWHLGAICLHLEAVTKGDIRRLLINIPPGHMKSLLVAVMWPAWEWLSKPEERTVFGCYARELATRDSEKCRDLVRSAWYQETFRPEWSLSKDQNAKHYFKNTAKGFRYALGVKTGTTGWRGHKIVFDDPLNAMDASSKAARDRANQWWFKAMSSRLNDKRRGKMVGIMQRLHDEDTSGEILRRGGYDHLCLMTEFEPKRRASTSIGWADPRTEEGELLFPQMFPRDVVDHIKTYELGSEGFAGQHQQSPAPDGGNKFKGDWIRRWEYVVDQPDLLRLHHKDGRTELVKVSDCRKFATVDLANSLKKSADYTVFSVWYVTPKSDLILVHVHRARMEDPDITPKGEELARRFNLAYLAVEANGIGLGIVQTMRRAGLPVRGVYAEGDKLARATTAIVRMEAGQVFFPMTAEWLADCERELTLFPNSHDDFVDTVSYAAIDVFQLGGAQEPEEEREARERKAQEEAHEAHMDHENPHWWGDEDD